MLKIRILEPDQFGRRAVYAFCGSCDQEHSFGTVYPDGDVEVQFPAEFNMDRQSAIATIREQL